MSRPKGTKNKNKQLSKEEKWRIARKEVLREIVFELQVDVVSKQNLIKFLEIQLRD